MIIRHSHGFGILFRETLPTLALFTLWDVMVMVLYQLGHIAWLDQPALPMSLIGSALAIFLGIRNNAAYGRWWEARSLWGRLTNNCRNFGREAATLFNGAPELVRAMAAYPHYLAAALSRTPVDEGATALLPAAMRPRVEASLNKADAILYEIGLGLRRIAAQRGVDGAAHAGAENILSELANAQGGLERIANTPLPVQYALLPNIVTHLFCLLLPLSAVEPMGWFTPFGSSIIGVLFQMLDRSGSDLQEPFKPSPHALPMGVMAHTIETNLLQQVGQQARPVPPAVKGVLP
ncbi:hypothetical protein E3E12_00250 [Formicincola oecophyllae]|uniref:Bestrophin n=1 Tax=Formicincola oecophyllae TaxID=2558361 RepID=A0A4Y6U6W3_9PROT|nr:bestrophin family ion channel [Formicincola oecophyllae]QDH12894.1 hypothetical protein E3E12_00250 [Formicincola oecophyllae]